jgi:hypothetical protein
LVILETIQTFWDVCFESSFLSILISRLKGLSSRIEALLGTRVSPGYRSFRFFEFTLSRFLSGTRS